MSFTPNQVAELSAPLHSSHVKHRQQAGRSLSYIEGWVCIAEANRIFGFGGWDRETTDMQLLYEPAQFKNASGKLLWKVGYKAQVRVTVRADGRATLVVRDGSGYGSGIDADLGSAHESAIKEAETDAMKRALMTFGNPFGLALYDKEQKNVVDDAAQKIAEAKQAAIAYVALAKTAMLNCADIEEADAWWLDEAPRRQENGVTKDTKEGQELLTAFKEHRRSLPHALDALMRAG